MLSAPVCIAFAWVGFGVYGYIANFNYEIENDSNTPIALVHCGSTSPRALAPHTTIKIHPIDGACAVYSDVGSTAQTYLGCIWDFGEGGYASYPTILDRGRSAASCD